MHEEVCCLCKQVYFEVYVLCVVRIVRIRVARVLLYKVSCKDAAYRVCFRPGVCGPMYAGGACLVHGLST